MFGTMMHDHLAFALDPGLGLAKDRFVLPSWPWISFEAYYYFTYASAVGRGPASGRCRPG